MERRLLVAIGLMLGVIVATNLLFPPVPSGPPGIERDTVGAVGERVVPDEPSLGEAAPEEGFPGEGAPVSPDTLDQVEGEPPGLFGERGLGAAPDTIVVRSPLYLLRFVNHGAKLVSAQLTSYSSYAEGDPESAPAELVRAGDHLLGYEVSVGPDTLDLSARPFEVSASEITISEGSPRDSLVFRYLIGSGERGPIVFRVTYAFEADRYTVGIRGEFEGVGDRGFTIRTSLGNGLRTNETDPGEDFSQLAFVTHGPGGIRSLRPSAVDPGERRAVEGGPFDWVAVKNKYFVIAYLTPEGSPGFGGLLVDGLPEEEAARATATLPVPAGSPGFEFGAYVGPQDYERLKAIGNDLENVNPVGWRWLQPVIRPLVAIVMAILTWMHEALGLAWGWVLVWFGVLMRIVLFPLYQKSMRAQMAQMRVQPLMKDIREKHKDDPQKMQQEMMRLYKEHNINPLAGCLPMMLPFPILITLFFVFRNTIEFRGVPFLWLPDLSLKDPYYIVPLLMGGSMFLLSWIGQRGMEQTAQTKMLGYGMPIMFTFLFANFPSGLNLYYATSNIASLPQQMYIAHERQKAQVPRQEEESEGPRAKAGRGKPDATGRKGDGGKKGGAGKKPAAKKKGGAGKKRASGKKASAKR